MSRDFKTMLGKGKRMQSSHFGCTVDKITGINVKGLNGMMGRAKCTTVQLTVCPLPIISIILYSF